MLLVPSLNSWVHHAVGSITLMKVKMVDRAPLFENGGCVHLGHLGSFIVRKPQVIVGACGGQELICGTVESVCQLGVREVAQDSAPFAVG